MFINLIAMMVYRCICILKLSTLYTLNMYVQFIICQPYFNKAMKNERKRWGNMC